MNEPKFKRVELKNGSKWFDEFFTEALTACDSPVTMEELMPKESEKDKIEAIKTSEDKDILKNLHTNLVNSLEQHNKI